MRSGLTQPYQFSVTASAESGLLCRVIGIFGQLQLPAPRLSVELADDLMDIRITASLYPAEADCIHRKVSTFVGVVDAQMVQGELAGQ